MTKLSTLVLQMDVPNTTTARPNGWGAPWRIYKATRAANFLRHGWDEVAA